MRNAVGFVVLVLLLGPFADMAGAAECAPPKTVVATSVGMKFCADPAFDSAIAGRLQTIRHDIRAQRQAGKLVIYASTPISPRGGGHMDIQVGIDTADDGAVGSYDGHGHPCSPLVKGWHGRPGKE